VAALLVASASAGVESAFGAWTTVADWEMNEPSTDAAIMHDSSGNGRYGRIGDAVETGVDDPDFGNPANRAYEWPAPAPAVRDDQRLVTVDRRAFNPRRDAFAVTLRLKTDAVDTNIIQKGQATTAGGLWKIEVDELGRAICFFRGSAGRRAVSSGPQLVNDNVWHTVRCERRRRSVSIIVDGGARRTQAGRTGRVANDVPVTIGGKFRCNPPGGPSCQYYVGLLDRVVVRRR
jgi:hypothetical protein